MQVEKKATHGKSFQKEAAQLLGNNDVKQRSFLGLRPEILERVYRKLSHYYRLLLIIYVPLHIGQDLLQCLLSNLQRALYMCFISYY